MLLPLQVTTGVIATDTSILSSIAIILGAVFVVYQIRQDKDMLAAQVKAADANSEQARLTMKQFIQNNDLATMDLVMRIYEFADSMEVQKSWFTVLRAEVGSLEDFDRLPEDKQLAFYQVASLFESLGFLVEKGFVKAEIVDDMFATKTAWEMTRPFILGMRKKFAAEDYYFFFERLYNRLSQPGTGSITGEFLDKLTLGKAQTGGGQSSAEA